MALKLREPLNLKGLTLAAIAEKVCARYGSNTMAIASKALGLKIEMISTGVYSLDFGLGGGVPKNRITEIFGNYSSLKSTILYNTIANFQRMHPAETGHTFFEDGEHSYDPAYAAACGVDNERVGIINSDSGEQAIDVLSDLLADDVHILALVDSIASLVPSAEMECSIEQQFQGLHPRLVGRMLRVLTGGVKRNMYDTTKASTTILATNQTREKIGVVYGPNESTPGGKAKDYYYSVRVRLTSNPSDKLMEKVSQNGVDREIRVGQNVKFEVRKNKVSGSQFEEGEFIYFTRPHKGHKAFTFNNEEILFKYGVFFGVIEIRGTGKKKKGGAEAAQYVYADNDFMISFASEARFKEELLANPRAMRRIYRKVMKALVAESKSGLVSLTTQ